ncbi:primosomal protein [Tomitella gaofuii]|uniref:primosomal protein n=1 Tax=Tomitella gaofuii TaxID=2760083 RepID=UPI0015FCBE9F|nr:primosomal protein [Tomitella gaofuii]
MAGDIVPIELRLHTGSIYTLWAPRWRDGEDEWQAFLGLEDEVFGFDSVAELTAFIRTDHDHDLYDHSSWHIVEALSADELTPEPEDRYDLTRVPAVAQRDPTLSSTRFLDDALGVVFALGDVCDIDSITDFLEEHGELDLLGSGTAPFHGRSGGKRWARIGRLLDGEWDSILAAIDDVISGPDVDAAALEIAEAELTASDENDVENDDELDTDDDLDLLDSDGSGDDEDRDGDDDDDDDADHDDGDDEYAFWDSVGIDPIQVVVPGGTYYTLRCYLQDDPVFLGRDGRIRVFTTPRALTQHLADNHDHDLAGVSTYSTVAQSATGGDLEIVITDDNVYVLTGLVEDITDGPVAVDSEQLDLAIELLEDAADYCDDDAVEQALEDSTELGALVSFIREPDPLRVMPHPPFTVEAGQWRALEHAFEDRLVQPDT